MDTTDFLLEMQIIKSKAEGRRLIHNGGIRVNKVQTFYESDLKEGDIVEVGKRFKLTFPDPPKQETL